VSRPLALNVAAIRELVDEVETVSESEMIDAIAVLHTRENIVAEPAAAAATAALLKRPDCSGAIVALVTGSNLAPDLAAKVRLKADPTY